MIRGIFRGRWSDVLSGRRLDRLLLAVALAVALLPDAALRPWTSDLARLVTLPAAPVSHLGIYLRDRIRPPRAAFDPRAPEVVELESEAERFRMLYERARLENERLERTIASLGAVSTRVGAGRHRLLEASVVGTDPTRRDGVLRINAGSRHGLREGAPAFLDGDAFVGVVGTDVGPLGATVVPSIRLTSIGVRLYPPRGSDPAAPASASPGAVLRPTGRGTWEADVASSVELFPGMVARLADERFPRAALGARVGRIVAVRPIEQVPLARRIEVEPIARTEELGTVVVAVEEGGGT